MGKLLCSNPYNQTIRIKYYQMLQLYKRQCKSEINKYRSSIFNLMENLLTLKDIGNYLKN